MKVKEMIEWLKKQDQDREVAFWEYKNGESHFYTVIPTCTPKANTTNLVCITDDFRIQPRRPKNEKTEKR